VNSCSESELWQRVLAAREAGDDPALNAAWLELDRRGRRADAWCRMAEKAVGLVLASVGAAAAAVWCLGVWKLFELCFGW